VSAPVTVSGATPSGAHPSGATLTGTHPSGATLAERAPAAIADEHLQQALGKIHDRYRRVRASDRADPRWPARRDRAAALRREVLSDFDGWIERAAASLEQVGAVVHRAATPAEAAAVVVGIARREGCRLAVKSKSMATEEIHLNAALEAVGIEVVEGDLGEYIVQVAGERPSHIITPAIHKTLQQVADLFSPLAGRELPVEREALCAFAREHLRERFLAADLGVTGANFLAADTGTIVLVTNEGNGRMVTAVPRVQVSVVPVDKIVPRLADLGEVLPLLTEHATAQTITAYLSMTTGPRRAGEVDGPEVLHVVLLDDHRRDLVGTPYEEMLACIRCGACLNACPVFRTVGGHAYDSVYPGPMGSILTPLLSGGEAGRDLPFASSLCGACTEICPVGIPLADLLVRLRTDLRLGGPAVPPRLGATPRTAGGLPGAGAAAGVAPPHHDRHRPPAAGFPWPGAAEPLARRRARPSIAWRAWAAAWSRPAVYRLSVRAGRVTTRLLDRRGERWVARIPLPGTSGWTATRDFPVVAPRSFRDQWATRGIAVSERPRANGPERRSTSGPKP
jgi:L-lactate dehydrogenase complex protein LldF